jgi:hypothetical protein
MIWKNDSCSNLKTKELVTPAPTHLETKEMLEKALDNLEKWFLLQPGGLLLPILTWRRKRYWSRRWTIRKNGSCSNLEACFCLSSLGDERDVGAGAGGSGKLAPAPTWRPRSCLLLPLHPHLQTKEMLEQALVIWKKKLVAPPISPGDE